MARRRKSIQEEFDEFDASNPRVYELFKHFTFEKIRKGAKKIGAAAVVERIRWEESCPTVGDEFKINNNFRAHYARKFMREFPECGAIFETRTAQGDHQPRFNLPVETITKTEKNGQQILI